MMDERERDGVKEWIRVIGFVELDLRWCSWNRDRVRVSRDMSKESR